MQTNKFAMTDDELDTEVVDVPIDPPRTKRTPTLELAIVYVCRPSSAELSIKNVRVVGRITLTHDKRQAIPTFTESEIDS